MNLRPACSTPRPPAPFAGPDFRTNYPRLATTPGWIQWDKSTKWPLDSVRQDLRIMNRLGHLGLIQ